MDLEKAQNLLNEISDINQVAIRALEKSNTCDGLEVVTVLSCGREKINKLYCMFNEEEKKK